MKINTKNGPNSDILTENNSPTSRKSSEDHQNSFTPMKIGVNEELNSSTNYVPKGISKLHYTLLVLYSMGNLMPVMAVLTNMDYFIFKYKVLKTN